MTWPSGRPPHVLHLATTHTPGDPRIVRKEIRTLVEAGARVGLVVPYDHDAEVEGADVHAVAPPATGRERLLRTAGEVARRALAEAGPDTVFHLHETDLLPFGIRQALRGRAVVYDAHEDTPRQTLHQPWIPAPLRRLSGAAYAAVEAVAGRALRGVVAAEPAIYERYPPGKTALVRNYPLLRELAGPGGAPYAERSPSVAYVGSLTRARGVEEMMAGVGAVAAERGVTFEVGGSFSPASLEAEVFPGGPPPWVRYHGYLDRPAVADVLGRVRAGLVLMRPVPMYLENYPTKLFEYLAAGLPVIASDFPNIRPFVEPYNCGLLVDPLDARAVADAVRWVLDHPAEAGAMGARGQAAVRERFGWAAEGERLLAFYRALVGGDPQPGAAAHAAVPV